MSNLERLIEALRAHLNAWRYTRSERETGGIVRLLVKIADPVLRLHRFGEHLGARTADEAAWSISTLYDLISEGDLQAKGIGWGLLNRGNLVRVLTHDHLEAIADALRRHKHAAAELFGDDPAHRVGERDLNAPAESVGYRISLARRALEGSIERLLFDTDPRVLRTLLGNPRLTEADVVNLAASKRASPEALELISQEERWVTRYPVKVALASNPATPVRVVVSLLPYLLYRDLRMVAARDTRTEVRRQATGLLSWRPDA
ncbi:MAG TPA: hypothetical protein VMD08_15735 [Candidatus Baltobacteraceae bacterium]|nr:hypothetical protein [Candidatus Baltobacteraceae bacterium]